MYLGCGDGQRGLITLFAINNPLTLRGYLHNAKAIFFNLALETTQMQNHQNRWEEEYGDEDDCADLRCDAVKDRRVLAEGPSIYDTEFLVQWLGAALEADRLLQNLFDNDPYF